MEMRWGGEGRGLRWVKDHGEIGGALGGNIADMKVWEGGTEIGWGGDGIRM